MGGVTPPFQKMLDQGVVKEPVFSFLAEPRRGGTAGRGAGSGRHGPCPLQGRPRVVSIWAVRGLSLVLLSQDAGSGRHGPCPLQGRPRLAGSWAVPSLRLVLLSHWQLCCRECENSPSLRMNASRLPHLKGCPDDPLLMLAHVEQELRSVSSRHCQTSHACWAQGMSCPSCHYWAQDGDSARHCLPPDSKA